MSGGKLERWMQVTSGTGPVECAWAVVRVIEKLCDEAVESGFEAKTIEIEPGPVTGTARSALIAISGSAGLAAFVEKWWGTVQWIAPSPFRPGHKRKNWFVGVEVLEPVKETHFDGGDVKWETMRASGPGGQHVNRTESAVRVTHVPTGMQASAMEERSQHRNRKLALARLAGKLEREAKRLRGEARDQRWRAHRELERGKPVRTLKGTTG